MDLANAYPNSDISTGAMVTIALVMVGTLVIWLAMVYIAARERNEHRGRSGHGDTTLATTGKTAENEHSGADNGHGTRPRGAVA